MTGCALILGTTSFSALAEKQKVKIAVIEGLSGPFAVNGLAVAREVKYNVEKYLNSDKIEAEVIALDGKTSPKDTLVQVKNAISQGARYIVQGNSSGVAHAILSAVEKHNSRNPEKRVLFLNHSAVDPALTEKKCSFWHFRFDAHVGMKLQALVGAIAANKEIKSVYIIGQDYSYGKAVAAGTVAFLKALRPDIKIVGNERHPIGKVQDFTPYAKKIQKSGADAIVTGNWGSDMVRLAQALGTAEVNAPIFTFYAAGTGVTATIAAKGEGRIRVVGEGKINPLTDDQYKNWKQFTTKHPGSDLLYHRIVLMVRMLSNAMEKANSVDPYLVAKALSGMKITRLDGTEALMRPEDHQILVGLYVLGHTKNLPKYEEKIVNDYDKSGYGLVSLGTIPANKAARPVKCKIKVPPK